MSPDFYYGEMLRWSFGFENPNKAAVVFACLIPLLWVVWLAGFSMSSKARKVSVLVASCLGFLAAWSCLLLTFSRGGLLAALMGMGVVSAWRLFPRTGLRFGAALESLKRPVGWSSVGLLAVVAAAAIFLGVGSRSLEAVGEDASVGNRLELWKTALQMAYENPSGFGAGRSGGELMQWYQAVDHTEGYRTMVNSYLTFLVERGWLPFSAAILVLAAFYAWTWPCHDEIYASWRVALWGSLTAFLVSGIFSTIMEEPMVWGIPILAGLVLIAFKFRASVWVVSFQRAGWAFTCATMILVSLFTTGMILSQNDPLERTFTHDANGIHTVTSVGLKKGIRTHPLCVFPDKTILGEEWGKLMRILATQTERKIWIQNTPDSDLELVDMLLIGDAAANNMPVSTGKIILLAPSIGDFPVNKISILLLSEIDEDGRFTYWRERLQASSKSSSIITLLGVGNRVEWAWEQVIEAIKAP